MTPHPLPSTSLLSRLAVALTVLCSMMPVGAATTTPTTAPVTTAPVAAAMPAVANADLLAFLLAENAKTISKIRTAQYHAVETHASPSRSPDVRTMNADVVREGANAWWSMQIPLKNAKTGITKPESIVAVRNKAGAITWYEKTAQATLFEADENGTLPKMSAMAVSVKEPFDVLKAVAAQGESTSAKFIASFSAPPRSIAVERDVKEPNIFYITMSEPNFEGPKAQAVLDASKGYLMTTWTSYWAPHVVAGEVRAELAQIDADRLWFPTSYEQVIYDPKQPKSVTHRQTSRLSNIILNQPLPSDAFEVSRLNFPDGLKVSVRPVVGNAGLKFWFKGNLLEEDAYMALVMASRKPARMK